MKNFIYIIFILVSLTSCNEGLLDKKPLDKYSDVTVWSDIDLADAVLRDCYKNTSHGFKGYLMLSAVTDEVYNKHMVGYVDGNLTADEVWTYWERQNGAKSLFHIGWWNFKNIQRINYFLDNIDQVAQAYSGEERLQVEKSIAVKKGEALFLRAFLYTHMARTYGGLPLLSESFQIDFDFSKVERSSFKETVDFIVADCDKAAELLPLKQNIDLGRATKEAALAIKSRILLFAASDLTADEEVVNELVGYKNADRVALWKSAKSAAKDVMDLATLQLSDFGAPDQVAVASNYFNFFKAKDLSDDEIIWGKMFLDNVGDRHRMNLWMGPNGQYNWSSTNVTQELVDNYEMADGSKFSEHFDMDADGYYFNKSNKYAGNIYSNREPRFYASVLYDGAKFQERIESLRDFDTIGIYDRRTVETIHSDGSKTQEFGLDTRQGPIQEWSGSFTGYIMKKMLDDEVVGKDEYNSNVWIEIRYAEILLNYAEACMELGELNEAEKYLNMVRNRAGMPDFEGDIEEALRHERQIELVFEDKRWFDIRRWKILDKVLKPVRGVRIIETRDQVKNDTVVTWQNFVAFDRGSITDKLYWIPLSIDELNKAPQLQQNPGY